MYASRPHLKFYDEMLWIDACRKVDPLKEVPNLENFSQVAKNYHKNFPSTYDSHFARTKEYNKIHTILQFWIDTAISKGMHIGMNGNAPDFVDALQMQSKEISNHTINEIGGRIWNEKMHALEVTYADNPNAKLEHEMQWIDTCILKSEVPDVNTFSMPAIKYAQFRMKHPELDALLLRQNIILNELPLNSVIEALAHFLSSGFSVGNPGSIPNFVADLEVDPNNSPSVLASLQEYGKEMWLDALTKVDKQDQEIRWINVCLLEHSMFDQATPDMSHLSDFGQRYCQLSLAHPEKEKAEILRQLRPESPAPRPARTYPFSVVGAKRKPDTHEVQPAPKRSKP